MQSEILVSNLSNLKIFQEFREFFRVFLLLGPSRGQNSGNFNTFFACFYIEPRVITKLKNFCRKLLAQSSKARWVQNSWIDSVSKQERREGKISLLQNSWMLQLFLQRFGQLDALCHTAHILHARQARWQRHAWSWRNSSTKKCRRQFK
jgi:hypothetical protein